MFPLRLVLAAVLILPAVCFFSTNAQVKRSKTPAKPAHARKKLPSSEEIKEIDRMLEEMRDGWVDLGDNDMQIFAFQPGRAESDADGLLACWFRAILREPQSESRSKYLERMRQEGFPLAGYERFYKQMERFQFNCQDRKVRTLEIVDYSTNGDVIHSGQSESRWETIIPESIGSKMFRRICSPPGQ